VALQYPVARGVGRFRDHGASIAIRPPKTEVAAVAQPHDSRTVDQDRNVESWLSERPFPPRAARSPAMAPAAPTKGDHISIDRIAP